MSVKERPKKILISITKSDLDDLSITGDIGLHCAQ